MTYLLLYVPVHGFHSWVIKVNLHSCVDGLGACGKGRNNPSVCEENVLLLLIF